MKPDANRDAASPQSEHVDPPKERVAADLPCAWCGARLGDPPALEDAVVSEARKLSPSEEGVRCRGCYREFHEACAEEFHRCPWTSCQSEERLPLHIASEAKGSASGSAPLKVLLPEQSEPASPDGDEEGGSFASALGFDPEREAVVEQELVTPGPSEPAADLAPGHESVPEAAPSEPSSSAAPSRAAATPDSKLGAASEASDPKAERDAGPEESMPQRRPESSEAKPQPERAAPASVLGSEGGRTPAHESAAKKKAPLRARPDPRRGVPSRDRARKRASRVPMALTAGLAVVVLAALLFWIERRKDLPHDYMQEQAAASRVQERASRRTPAPSLFEGPEDSASDRWDLVPKPSPEAEAGEGADEVAWTAEDAGDESTRFAFNRQLLAASAALSELYQAQKSLLGFERSLQFSERYQQRVGGIADDVQRNRATVQLKTTDRNLAAEQYLEELRLLRVYRGPAYAGLLAAFQAVQDRADAPAPKILALVLKHAEEPEATESLVYQRERWLAELAE